MARNYGLGLDKLVENPELNLGHTGTTVGALTGYQAGFAAAQAAMRESADSNATEAGVAASQQQTRGGLETSEQKGSQYYDRNQAGGANDGNYVMNAAGRRGYNEDGSDMTAEQTAMEDRGVAPTYGPTQYGLGANPTEYRDKQFSAAERDAANTAGQAKYYEENYSPGSKGKAMGLRAASRAAQADEQQSRFMEGQLRMQPTQQRAAEQGLLEGDLRLGGLRRTEQYAADEQKAMQRGTDLRTRMSSADPNEVIAALNDAAKIHSDSTWGGNSKSRVYQDANGRIMVEFDPGNGLPKEQHPFSNALADKITASYTEHNVNAASPAGMRLAAQELRKATQAGDTVAAKIAGDKLQSEGQLAHTAAVVSASAQRSAEHIASMQQQLALHGPDSPQGKILGETLRSTEDYNKRVKSLMDNREKLSPEELVQQVAEIKMLHPDKGVTKLGTYENGVKTGETTTSVFDQFAKASINSVAGKLTTEAEDKYPGAGIKVISGPSGKMLYTSPKSTSAATPHAYTSLEELVKTEKIKSGGRGNAQSPTPEGGLGAKFDGADTGRDADFARNYYGSSNWHGGPEYAGGVKFGIPSGLLPDTPPGFWQQKR